MFLPYWPAPNPPLLVCSFVILIYQLFSFQVKTTDLFRTQEIILVEGATQILYYAQKNALLTAIVWFLLIIFSFPFNF